MEEPLVGGTGLTEAQIHRIGEDISELILRTIDADKDYLVCNGNVTDFVTKRLLNKQPIAIVSQKGLSRAVPPRDYGIYMIREDDNALEPHNSINVGFVGYMIDCGLGVRKLGGDLTYLDIVVSAKAEVLMRLQAQES